jgi:hypothetical protein
LIMLEHSGLLLAAQLHLAELERQADAQRLADLVPRQVAPSFMQRLKALLADRWHIALPQGRPSLSI